MIFKLNDAFVVAFSNTAIKSYRRRRPAAETFLQMPIVELTIEYFFSCWRIKLELIFRQNIVFFFDCHTEFRMPIKVSKLGKYFRLHQRCKELMMFGLIQS